MGEEAVEFAASGVEGTLLVFGAVMNERAAALVDRVSHEPFCGELS